MTTRYTDEEWQRIIASTQASILPRTKHSGTSHNGSVASTNHSDAPSTSSSSLAPTYRVPGLADPAFNRTIDHTLLKLDAKAVQLDNLCAEARVHGFATVCVRPQWVERCVKNLKGSGVGVACVIGFHEGTYDLYHKLSYVLIP